MPCPLPAWTFPESKRAMPVFTAGRLVLRKAAHGGGTAWLLAFFIR